ncbi:refilin-A [Fundulus heteroclitus]|uniref:refilin-A n=1 Tax=Fundulus heteroclitus TaxID=8078 RepID=UPI00165BD4F4|nr:refilin-A [Fundulus heteroclitus]XP_021174045.2 refilin-A [Fundulus heteroclitus]
MVGHLHLQAMDDSLKGKNREGLLDSPDSGLPPSPSPPFCPLSPAPIEPRSGGCATPVDSFHGCYRKESREGKLLPYLLLNSAGTDLKSRMHPVFYGESIEVNPKAEQEIKCTSAVKYDSDKHYRDRVVCAPVPMPTYFSETVVAVQNCTWRSYKTQVYLEPRQKPVSYQSTTIIYPKHAKNTYRTTLSYNPTGSRRWFVSTVQLEASEDTSPCIIYTEDL